MKLLSRSALVALTASAGFLVASVPGSAYSGCAFSKMGSPDTAVVDDGPSGFLAASPDSDALGAALGGLGAIAALLTGGALLVRQRRLAQVAAANEAALAAEANPTITTETVVLPETAETAIDAIEGDLVASVRR